MSQIRTSKFTRIIEGTNFRFVEYMDDLVRVRNIEGEILFENQAMRQVINEILHKENTDDDSDAPFIIFQKRGKRDFKTELTLNSKLYNVRISPITSETGEILGYIEVYRDVTSERKITRELCRAHKKLNDEMVLAKTIQKSILPKKNKYNNICFQYGHVPSGNLSGDLFDVVVIDKNRTGVYIADVVGHSISASIMTMFIRQSMRSILQENPDLGPSDTIRELKEMFAQLELDVSQYFSIIYILIDSKEKKIKYVNAGHNCMPILFNDKKIAFLQNKGKFISNLFKDEKYVEKELELVEGDKILLYTDGLTETTNEKGEFFGEEKLINWIRKNKKEEKIVEKLLSEIKMFRHNEQVDDIAVLQLEIGGVYEN